MKRLKTLLAIKAIFTLIFLIYSLGGSANAQDIGITNRPRITSVSGAATANRTSIRKPATRIQVITKPVYITKNKMVKISPTGLSITTLPNADITLESIARAKTIKKQDKAGANGVLTFEDLAAGKYKLSASLESYQTQESEIIIIPQKIATIPINLKRVTHEFSIQTNVEKGEVRFAPVKVLGQNPDGTLKVEETGGYCVAAIKGQKATIKELPEGTYNIDVRAPDNPEYEQKLAVIKIPEDIPETKANDPNENELFKIDLENKLSTGTFNQFNNQEVWELPEKWKIDTKGIKANGTGVALLKERSFRYYKDFEMQSSVRLLNNSSVGFVVRAKDENNYYLIQLTGADSKEPYLVSGFIVKDGKVTERVLGNPIKFGNLEKTFSNQKPFTVIIKGHGNVFEVFVEDTATGNTLPLGNALFKDNNFPIGAVGLMGIEKSSFEVDSFTICNEVCN
jgi:predicted RNA-binding protein with TRAM domain